MFTPPIQNLPFKFSQRKRRGGDLIQFIKVVNLLVVIFSCSTIILYSSLVEDTATAASGVGSATGEELCP